MDRLTSDPVAAVLEQKPDLPSVLDKLAAELTR
jgi:hypothetical protein